MADLIRIEELTLKRLLGTINPVEDLELQALADASDENREFIERMKPETFRAEVEALREIDFDRLDRLMKKKLGHIPGVLEWVPEETTWIRRAARPLVVAASVLLITGGAWLFSRKAANNGPVLPLHIDAYVWWQPFYIPTDNTMEILGRNKIDLGDMQEGKGYIAGKYHIARMGDQFFVNQWADTAVAAADSADFQFTNGAKSIIQLFFQNATRIQLYPGSTISFRTRPIGKLVKETEMTCSGRVLFYIEHDPQNPFIVKTPKQEITVLGTVFEVQDFSKENTSAVFCYSGSVLVTDQGSAHHQLEATQRLIVDASNMLEVSTGGFPKAPQWSSKELMFDFSDMNLDTAMKRIAQWYGLAKVEFDPTIDRQKTGTVYSGKLSRYLTLQRLLGVLDRNDLHFQIQGQTLLVSK